MALVLDVSPPTSGRSTWQATVLMPRSPASIETRRQLAPFSPSSVSGSGSGEIRNSYLCGDDVELELLPVVVGLFESLNLTSQRQIISCRVEQMKSGGLRRSLSRFSYVLATS